MSEITMDNFIMDKVIKTASGRFLLSDYYTPVGRWDINYSDIFTYLIQQTGRLVDNFASDLFIDLFSLMSQIKADTEGNFANRKMLFGLHTNGVDGNNYVCRNMEGYKYPEYPYRALFMLEITVNKRDMEWKLGTVKFTRNI